MPAKKTIRIKLTLSGAKAKVFTSEGPLVTGSVVELPSAEAERLIKLGKAHMTADDAERIEPATDIEGGLVEQTGNTPAEPDD